MPLCIASFPRLGLRKLPCQHSQIALLQSDKGGKKNHSISLLLPPHSPTTATLSRSVPSGWETVRS